MERVFIPASAGFICEKNSKVIVESISEGWKYSPTGNRFNLPAGNYIIYGKFRIYEKLDYPKINIKGQKRFDFSEVKINYVSNPHKASINTSNGEMFVDRSFYKQSNPIQRKFLILHELGHYALDGGSEKNANDFAINSMIELGYNPKQLEVCFNMFFDEKRRAGCYESAYIFKGLATK